NGEERTKGNELTRRALELIEGLPCFSDPNQKVGEFVGYAEGKELFKGQIDVLVTDGFIGNLVLQAVAGLGLAGVTLREPQARAERMEIVGVAHSAGALRKQKQTLD